MCILRIPQHPWCHCTDPSNIGLFEDELVCQHHIWIRPDVKHNNDTNLPAEARLNQILANITRPGPAWAHCPAYVTQHTNAAGVLVEGNEYVCPETLLLQARKGKDGHKQFYPWDGLCAHCDNPARGIPLDLVPLRNRYIVQPDSAGPEGDDYTSMVPSGFETPEGKMVDAELYKRMTTGRGACGGGEGVYVDVVEQNINGWWGVFEGRSAVYLLPGHHNLVSKGEKWTTGWMGALSRLGTLVKGNKKFL
ncbi:hypothetical protein NEMBOFW57_006282 [Staphylotrichum longicolle]|uniref:Uncharacterized protein n=1 Tax=Staphylotrichum longicolle TaxID=669026 RepID=A0AAD4I145_9PEZI|nr:hypothetical protein NEMBOFW57_006282 [Staphylotrichum longicolle]